MAILLFIGAMAVGFVAGVVLTLTGGDGTVYRRGFLLLLELRGVGVSELVQRTVEQKLDLMLVNVDARIFCVIYTDGAELAALFRVL